MIALKISDIRNQKLAGLNSGILDWKHTMTRHHRLQRHHWNNYDDRIANSIFYAMLEGGEVNLVLLSHLPQSLTILLTNQTLTSSMTRHLIEQWRHWNVTTRLTCCLRFRKWATTRGWRWRPPMPWRQLTWALSLRGRTVPTEGRSLRARLWPTPAARTTGRWRNRRKWRWRSSLLPWLWSWPAWYSSESRSPCPVTSTTWVSKSIRYYYHLY